MKITGLEIRAVRKSEVKALSTIASQTFIKRAKNPPQLAAIGMNFPKLQLVCNFIRWN